MNAAGSVTERSSVAAPRCGATGGAAGGPPSPSLSSNGAISPEQLQEIAFARHQARKITRAASVASFSGWTMAFFASISILSGIFNLPALLLGVGLGIVAFIELRGAKGLRAFDPGAPPRLALNQLALLVMVTIYAGWGIVHTLVGPGPYDAQLAAGGQVAEMLEPIDRLSRFVAIAFYALLIGGSVIAQSCVSAYYFTRRGHMLAYLRRTPQWIVETLRTASA